MGAFELNNKEIAGNPADRCEENLVLGAEFAARPDPRKIKEECIIALKVYDSCRQQDCLTPNRIGPARAAECVCIGDEHVKEGDIIDPPSNAATVVIDRLKIKKIVIVDKDPNPFKQGFWDIDLKYVFEYRLTFREADYSQIGSPVKANSIFNKKVTLFGSIGSDLVIGTDLFKTHHESTTLEAEPFIWVEAKAVALSAELKLQRRRNFGPEDFAPEPNEVLVTIGLFTIIKLFRIVNLTVQSKGFCIPPECEEISPTRPCEFFEDLDFPMDIFAPPQKPEFIAGISGNIPRERRREREDCGRIG